MVNITAQSGAAITSQQFGWNITSTTTGEAIAKTQFGRHLS